jgi:hypothetical protein
MTERCADLDEFFDGELAADQADAFRAHLPTCERCQDMLHGRMQETMAARVAARVVHVEPSVVKSTARAPVTPPVMTPAVAPPAVTPPDVTPIKLARRRGCGRVLAYLAPALAAAAVIPLWLAHRDDSGFKLSLGIDRSRVTKRGIAAHVGDVLRPTVHGERRQAVWVYVDDRDDRELVIACPSDHASCREAGGELTVELRLNARGRYAILALGSDGPIPAPGKTFDQALAAARSGGITTRFEFIDVN